MVHDNTLGELHERINREDMFQHELRVSSGVAEHDGLCYRPQNRNQY